MKNSCSLPITIAHLRIQAVLRVRILRRSLGRDRVCVGPRGTTYVLQQGSPFQGRYYRREFCPNFPEFPDFFQEKQEMQHKKLLR